MKHRSPKTERVEGSVEAPKKSLGQNFLVNQGILEKIVAGAELDPLDTILEIGPGRGALTEALRGKARRVIAIEKDHRLIEALAQQFKSAGNTEILEGDILEFKIENLKLKAGEYKIVANIPYYITSHLLKSIFEEWPTPKLIVLMVQKEVAHRICAKVGESNLLALSVQYYATPKILGIVSRGSFRPIPNVDSAILLLRPHLLPTEPKFKTTFFKLIKSGFANKRKQLLGTLAKAMPKQKHLLVEAFKMLNLSPEVRPQDVPLETWNRMASMVGE